jgi:TolB-like protein
MVGFLADLRRRKLVQWTLAYVAGAWALLQALGLAADSYGWPHRVMQIAIAAVALGFVVTLLLAWYHGERGAQRVSGAELLLIALVLAVGGGLLWHFGRPAPAASATAAAPGEVPNTAKSMPKPGIASVPIAAQPIPAKSIAVLPFENLSTEKGNAYFADGMQDLILTKLADIGDLKVISRTSTLQYGSHPGNLKQIGEQLGVATILEGSVQKAGNQVLINVQLIDARSDNHIWAQSYQRTLDNIFGVEGEVAQKVADALKAKLTSAESVRVASVPTTNPAAYDAYLRGEHFLGKSTVVGDYRAALPMAVAAFQQAVEADPKFALAWARLGFCRSLLAYFGLDTSDAMRDRALANARRAFTLSPDLPEAHGALGYVYRIFFADYARALAEYRLAERGAPNNANVIAAIAYVEWFRGDAKASAATLQRASILDPRSVNIAANLATMLAGVQQWDAARGAARRAQALEPEDARVYVQLARLDVLQHGDVAAALRELAQAPPAPQSDPALVSERVALMLLGRDAQRAQATAMTLAADQYLLLRALASARAGQADAARALYLRVLSRQPPPAVLTPVWLERGPSSELFDRAEAQAALGRRTEADDGIRKFLAFARSKGSVHAVSEADYTLARIDARAGDAKDAIDNLRQVLDAAGTGWIVTVPLLKLDPVWDPVRKDPRFQALLKQHDNAQPAAASSGAAQ